MDQSQATERVKQVKNRYQEKLLGMANVVGLGIGFKEKEQQLTDQIALIVNVTEKKPLSELAPEDVVPVELDGIVTDVQEIGQFKAF